MKVSFLMLTLDRYDTTNKTLYHNIKRCPGELLVCDNGSTDRRVIENLPLKPDYHRINSKNEGCAKSFNQLYLRSTGDIIVLLGNDILLPQGWLDTAIRYIQMVERPGIVGIDWGLGTPPLCEKFGVKAHFTTKEHDKVFGVWIMQRKVIEEIGFFYDGFDVYGLEDSDFNNRVNLAGFNSFYLPNLRSEHLENDVGTTTEYRRMKDASLQRNAAIINERIKNYDKGIKEPLPERRGPL